LISKHNLFMRSPKSDVESQPTIRGDCTHEHDPFAVRSGKVLNWRNVEMSIKNRGEKDNVSILKNVWGEVPPGKVCAIMGPSGAGKTSLLNILSGRSRTRKNVVVSQDMRFDNYAVNPTDTKMKKQIAFVEQHDGLQQTSTPREAINFSARLRLPRSISDSDVTKLTNRMITELGLNSCADTVIGGQLIRGISGGERKRTSVGVELVVKPGVIFLDEPTSGLDSYSALRIVQVLKKVATSGASVLLTIHQPASEVFNSFDHLLLLNKGRIMFQGELKTMPQYFADRGYPLPINTNPSDWIMYIAQTVDEKDLETSFFLSENTQIESEIKVPSDIENKRSSNGEQRVSYGTEIKLLFKREFNNILRDKSLLAGRLMITGSLATILSCIFVGVGKADNSDSTQFNSHFGISILVCIQSMFGTGAPTLLSFPAERPVFLREYATNHYSIFTYMLSRLFVEAFITFIQITTLVTITHWTIGFQINFFLELAICYGLAMSSTALAVMLGCAVEEVKTAAEFLPLLYVPQMLFAGFFVATSLIPKWLRWAQYLCSLTYAVRLFVGLEFKDCGYESPIGSTIPTNCERVFASNEINPDHFWLYALTLFALFVFFRSVALILLMKKATKYY